MGPAGAWPESRRCGCCRRAGSAKKTSALGALNPSAYSWQPVRLRVAWSLRRRCRENSDKSQAGPETGWRPGREPGTQWEVCSLKRCTPNTANPQTAESVSFISNWILQFSRRLVQTSVFILPYPALEARRAEGVRKVQTCSTRPPSLGHLLSGQVCLLCSLSFEMCVSF